MSEADKASAVGDEGPDMVGGSAENANTNQGTASSSAEPMNPLSSQSVTPAVAEDGGCSPRRSLGSPKSLPNGFLTSSLTPVQPWKTKAAFRARQP